MYAGASSRSSRATLVSRWASTARSPMPNAQTGPRLPLSNGRRSGRATGVRPRLRARRARPRLQRCSRHRQRAEESRPALCPPATSTARAITASQNSHHTTHSARRPVPFHPAVSSARLHPVRPPFATSALVAAPCQAPSESRRFGCTPSARRAREELAPVHVFYGDAHSRRRQREGVAARRRFF